MFRPNLPPDLTLPYKPRPPPEHHRPRRPTFFDIFTPALYQSLVGGAGAAAVLPTRPSPRRHRRHCHRRWPNSAWSVVTRARLATFPRGGRARLCPRPKRLPLPPSRGFRGLAPRTFAFGASVDPVPDGVDVLTRSPLLRDGCASLYSLEKDSQAGECPSLRKVGATSGVLVMRVQLAEQAPCDGNAGQRPRHAALSSEDSDQAVLQPRRRTGCSSRSGSADTKKRTLVVPGENCCNWKGLSPELMPP